MTKGIRALLTSAVLAVALPAAAENIDSETTALVKGDLAGVISTFSASAAVQRTDQHVGLRAIGISPFEIEMADGSNFTVTFDRLQEATWPRTFRSPVGVIEDPSATVLFRGEATNARTGEKVGASGSAFLDDGILKFLVHLLQNGQAVAIEVPISDSTVSRVAKATVADVSALENVKCGVKHPPAGALRATASVGTPDIGRATSQIVEIATDADGEWYALYGASSNSRIAAILNAANTIYQRDLGLEIQLASQNVWTSSGSDPYSSTDSEALLNSFTSYTNANQHLGSADLFHLFTGKDMNDGTVGIAWMGVACAAPEYSYGVTQRLSDSLDHLIAAHEIGHNFDANHDSGSSPRSIMYPSVGATQNFFSALSVQEIGAHRSAHGASCLTGTYSPDPRSDEPGISLSLSFSSSRGTFSGSLARSNITGECAFALEFARSRDFADRSAKRIGSGDYSLVSFTGRGARKVKARSSEANAVYVRARAVCSGTTYVSRARGFRVTRSGSSDYPTLRSWVSGAARSVRVSQAE